MTCHMMAVRACVQSVCNAGRDATLRNAGRDLCALANFKNKNCELELGTRAPYTHASVVLFDVIIIFCDNHHTVRGVQRCK